MESTSNRIYDHTGITDTYNKTREQTKKLIIDTANKSINDARISQDGSLQSESSYKLELETLPLDKPMSIYVKRGIVIPIISCKHCYPVLRQESTCSAGWTRTVPNVCSKNFKRHRSAAISLGL